MIQSKLFERLNIFTYTIHYSDDSRLVVWKDHERREQLYTIRGEGKFEIYDPHNMMLADNMTEDKVLDFIEADMGVGSPLPEKIDKVFVNTGGKPRTETRTERIINSAAKRHGVDLAGSSLLKDLAARKEINKKTSGMVRKKRKIDISDLDLDEDD